MAKKKKAKSMKAVLKEIEGKLEPDEQAIGSLKNLSRDFIHHLERELKIQGFDAQAFIGGSFAKGTLVKKEHYDLDILVRFDWRYDDISSALEEMLKKICKTLDLKYDLVHGSRDYFQVYPKSKDYYLEVVPVARIKHPKEARNVTDLSYFHVPYVKRKIKGLESQVRLAKAFLKAQRAYGAETYVSGFSGYAVELLIIYYKTFEKMLRKLSEIEKGGRMIIDIEKSYKNKTDVFFDLNESKLNSPVILIDPTYKERNALAALSRKTFERFQKAGRAFLKKPTEYYFKEKEIDLDKIKARAKKIKAEFIHLELKTDRQPGDIAGTKLKKFHYIVERELWRYFKLTHHEFHYDKKQGADVYLILKSRKEVVRIGPPLHMKKHVRAFEREHMSTYEKNKFIHAKLKVKFGAREFLDVWKKGNKKLMREMGITGMEVKKD